MEKNSKLKYLLPIRCIMFILIFVIGSIITKQNLSDISNWWSIVATVVNIITILILILVTEKMKSNYWKLINYEKGKTRIKQVIVIALVVLWIGILGMYLAGFICYGKFPYAAPMMIAPIPLILAIINCVILPITVPLFFYALQHSFIPTLFDGKYIIYRFLSFLPLTIILCWYYKKKQNPLPIMVGHALIEIASVAMILMTSISPELYQTMLNM